MADRLIGRRVQSPETGKCQNQEDYKKENAKSRRPGKKHWLTWKHTRQNCHRKTGNTEINTLGKTRHLEGVETIMRTGETDQGVPSDDDNKIVFGSIELFL